HRRIRRIRQDRPGREPDRGRRPDLDTTKRGDPAHDPGRNPLTMSEQISHPPHHFAVGVGAGPSNLSLAALFRSASRTERDLGDIVLFDRQPASGWHEALLHNGVRMQTSWLKDLVSIVDPTHELTFLNYIVTTGRLFALLNAQFDVIPRREYMRYLEW